MGQRARARWAYAASIVAGAVLLATASWAQESAPSFPIPHYETPADNAWDHYQRAASLLPKRGTSGRIDLDTATPAAMRLAYSENKDALAELRRGLGKPCVISPARGLNLSEHFLAQAHIRELARRLALEARVRLEDGNVAGAFQSGLDGLTLGQDAARNGAMVDRLVSIACEAIALKTIRQVAGHAASDQDALSKAAAGLASAEEHEVPTSETLALEYVLDRGNFDEVVGEMANDPSAANGFRSTFGVRPDPAGIAQYRQDLQEAYAQEIAVSNPEYWRLPANVQDRSLRKPPADVPPGDPVLMGRFLQCVAHNQAGLRGTLLVVALELYRARHGGYPRALTDLVPDTLAKLPVDPFSGQAFHYSLAGDGTYKLYSVGENRKDDGGVEAPRGGRKGGDLIFSTAK